MKYLLKTYKASMNACRQYCRLPLNKQAQEKSKLCKQNRTIRFSRAYFHHQCKAWKAIQ